MLSFAETQGMSASRQPNKCHIMEMDRNREIYVHGSGEHINVNMDFKRFFLLVVFMSSTFMKLKFVMTRLSRPQLVGILMMKKYLMA